MDREDIPLPPHGTPPPCQQARRVLDRPASSPIRPSSPATWAEALAARAAAGEPLTIFQRDILREWRERTRPAEGEE